VETSFKSFCLSDWAPACESFARSLAVAIVATYAAGYAMGAMIHRWNDRLATLASGRRIDPPTRPVRLAQAAAITPAAIAAPPLASLTVVELRRLARAAGHRQLARSGRRADLLAVLG
jgi:non-ribosomal peptide synthetase component F